MAGSNTVNTAFNVAFSARTWPGLTRAQIQYLQSLGYLVSKLTQYGPTTARPLVGQFIGEPFFDLTQNQVVNWNGSEWANVADQALTTGTKVAVFENGTLITPSASLDFNTSPSINVTVTGVGGNTQANIWFQANGTAIVGPTADQANLALFVGQEAYAAANAAANTGVAGYANGTLVLADADVNWNNTATLNVSVQANGTTQLNVAWNANGTAIVGPTAAIANGAAANALAAYAAANAAANTVATYANGTLILADSDLNWNNTATLNVSVTANGTGQSNIAWSANGTAIVGPTAVIANGAATNALAAYAEANAAANTVATYANGSLILADADLNFNNTATVNVAASANGTGQTNVAFSVNTAAIIISANSTLGPAVNAAANTVATFANGTLVLADANLNFNNTATLNVSITANGTTQTNVALNANGTAIVGPTAVIANGAATNALAAYAEANAAANTVATYANGSLILADANINFNNTATMNVLATANGTGQVNVAFSVNTAAIAASDNNYQADILANGTIILANANSNFNNTATINVALSANAPGQANISLNANGTAIVGPTAIIANGAATNALAAYSAANAAANTCATYANGTLILADSTDNFNNTATINVSVTANGTTQANIAFNANGTAIVGPTAVIANTANTNANLAYGQANTATTIAEDAYQEANTAAALANQANTFGYMGITLALAANANALAAYAQANAALNVASDVFANGTLVNSNTNINFNNAATTILSVTANGTSNTNVSVSVNTSAQFTWSGLQAFTGPLLPGTVETANGGIVLGSSGNTAWFLDFIPWGGTANGRTWEILANPAANNFVMRCADDTRVNLNNFLVITRANGTPNVTAMSYGSSLDYPNQTIFGPVQIQGNTQASLLLNDVGAPANTGQWQFVVGNAGQLVVRALNDAENNVNPAIQVTRTSGTSNVTSIIIGNAQDLPNFIVDGPVFMANTLNNPTVNSAANTVATFANGTIVLANANLNFNNTSTINVAASANGTTQANVAFSVNATAIAASVNTAIGGAYLPLSAGPGNTITGQLWVTSGPALIYMNATNAAVNTQLWRARVDSTGLFHIESLNDSQANINQAIEISRTSGTSNIFGITLGSSVDNPEITLNGTYVAVLGPSGLVQYNPSTANANTARWNSTIPNANGTWYFEAQNDAQTNTNYLFTATRANGTSNITALIIGSTVDLPNVTVLGNVITTSNVYSGNIINTQNTTTGNIVISTLANTASLNVSIGANIAALNVSGTSNLLSTVIASGSPTVNNLTQVVTGLSAFKSPTSTSANATLTPDNSLILTFNETGRYVFELYLVVFEATSGTGGFQFDLGSNTAITANISYDVNGFGTSAIATSAGITANNTATSVAAIGTTAASPSWVRAKGYFQVTTKGTIGVRWAQASLLAIDPTSLKEGSYFIANKIG